MRRGRRMRGLKEFDTRKMFRIKRTRRGLYIKALVVDWELEDLVDALSWEDLYFVGCDEWEYIVDARDMETVYMATDYGYNLIEELREDGETIVPKSQYTVQDYIDDGCVEFEEFVRGY